MITQSQTKGTGGGSQSRVTSQEERASIEAQCGFKIIAELVVADKLPLSHPLGQYLLCWLDRKTGKSSQSSVISSQSSPNGPKSEEGKEILTPRPEEKEPGLRMDSPQSETEKPAAPVIEFPPPRHFDNAGQLLTAASRELHLTRAEVLYVAGKIKASEIEDLDGVWGVLSQKAKGKSSEFRVTSSELRGAQ